MHIRYKFTEGLLYIIIIVPLKHSILYHSMPQVMIPLRLPKTTFHHSIPQVTIGGTIQTTPTQLPFSELYIHIHIGLSAHLFTGSQCHVTAHLHPLRTNIVAHGAGLCGMDSEEKYVHVYIYMYI